jgi:hypothetical protein
MTENFFFFFPISADVEMFVWFLSLGKFEAANTDKKNTRISYSVQIKV